MGSKGKGHGLLIVEDRKDSKYARTARSQGLCFVPWSTKELVPIMEYCEDQASACLCNICNFELSCLGRTS